MLAVCFPHTRLLTAQNSTHHLTRIAFIIPTVMTAFGLSLHPIISAALTRATLRCRPGAGAAADRRLGLPDSDHGRRHEDAHLRAVLLGVLQRRDLAHRRVLLLCKGARRSAPDIAWGAAWSICVRHLATDLMPRLGLLFSALQCLMNRALRRLAWASAWRPSLSRRLARARSAWRASLPSAGHSQKYLMLTDTLRLSRRTDTSADRAGSTAQAVLRTDACHAGMACRWRRR
jgi:hypothetical protein